MRPSALERLRDCDPGLLRGDHRRIAFWLNLFNTLVIHGVIACGVRESVREIPFFFDRARYRVGPSTYTLSEIEHGILRLRHCLRELEPRIHFALVCASRSCPPIGVYEENRLDDQLATSARVFINATTSLHEQEGVLQVSQVFSWYRRDFGRDRAGLIRYIAGHLHDEASRERILARARRLRLAYRPYDWRLNR